MSNVHHNVLGEQYVYNVIQFLNVQVQHALVDALCIYFFSLLDYKTTTDANCKTTDQRLHAVSAAKVAGMPITIHGPCVFAGEDHLVARAAPRLHLLRKVTLAKQLCSCDRQQNGTEWKLHYITK